MITSCPPGKPLALMLDAAIDVDVRQLAAFARRLNQEVAVPPAVSLDSVRLADLAGDLLPD